MGASIWVNMILSLRHIFCNFFNQSRPCWGPPSSPSPCWGPPSSSPAGGSPGWSAGSRQASPDDDADDLDDDADATGDFADQDDFLSQICMTWFWSINFQSQPETLSSWSCRLCSCPQSQSFPQSPGKYKYWNFEHALYSFLKEQWLQGIWVDSAQ